MKHKRQLVFLCGGSDCKGAGSKTIKKELKSELKSGVLKGHCKLIETKCLDMCKSAPVGIVGNHFCKKASADHIVKEIKKALDLQG
ncbi:(2Fe-2S) ferredoxin domain-containing protein [Algoriphagus hitonicola]|uniref:Thioredoxin-like [2Fe-2S] ferredoxin n=1 Tax=Algoriphagus hitonicola TaxID=435880 RepID=A0A1I2TW27_9BACT|nr:(2Fe-2S) ferredoxin domain-containing protein [Algoriphagus hitonicola]SFG66531.1 Thioredoxin-like [2Fe-2S] ferredoxin [Algoriphagus hitonicola]